MLDFDGTGRTNEGLFSASQLRDRGTHESDEQSDLPLAVRIDYGLPANYFKQGDSTQSRAAGDHEHDPMSLLSLMSEGKGSSRDSATAYGGNSLKSLNYDFNQGPYRQSDYRQPGAPSDRSYWNQDYESSRDLIVNHEMREMELLINQTQAIVNLLNVELYGLKRELESLQNELYPPAPPHPYPGPEPFPPQPYPGPEPRPYPEPRPQPSPEPRPQPSPEPRPQPFVDHERHHGVNLSGAEFGEGSLPGKLGSDYVFPTTQELDYYKQKGIDLVRLPFFWERMQPGLLNKNSPDAGVDRSFDPVYAGQLDAFLTAADQRGMKVALDAQQFGRYKHQVIGASNITDDDFKKFWGQMSRTFGHHSCIYGYDLSNEPYDEDNKTWHDAAQAGLDGIRAAGDRQAVVVEGNQWSGTWSWQQYNNDFAVQDPENNVIYSAHSYWDSNHGGGYDGGSPGSFDRAVAEARRQNFLGQNEDPSNIGINETKPFVEWLKKHNARGFIGEYGVPQNDPNWTKVQDKFLAYAKANGLDTAAWGGGPWWGKDYALALETGPKGENSVDGPEPQNMKSVENDGNGF